jgi:threonine synthase
MRFVSTRGQSDETSLSDAITRGLAPDGGLYVPTFFPTAEISRLEAEASLAGLAVRLLEPFFAGDRLASELEAICEEAFDFPAPLRDLPRRTAVLELFHGPTAAFKDFGARFLAATLARLREDSAAPAHRSRGHIG